MLYLQNVRGFTPVEAGVRTLPLSLASLVASPLGAPLTQRYGPRLTMPLGRLFQARLLLRHAHLADRLLLRRDVAAVRRALGAVLAAAGIRRTGP